MQEVTKLAAAAAAMHETYTFEAETPFPFGLVPKIILSSLSQYQIFIEKLLFYHESLAELLATKCHTENVI